MTWSAMFALTIIGLLFLMFMGNWIAISLGITGFIGLIVVTGTKFLNVLGSVAWNATNSYALTAIPMFVLMGEILIHSGVSNKFYHAASKWLGRLPGGILQTNIISCAIFAAISGSSPATAAAVGSVAYPEMTRQGYNKSMIIGSLGGGGALGILIPPSIPMIIYGSVAEVSIEKLFMAGVVPGLVAVVIFMVYIVVAHLLNKNLSPEKPPKASLIEKIKAINDMLPLLFLALVILGSIYLGWATPTEAAALGVLVSIIISLFMRTLTIKNFISSMVATVKTTAMILMIIVGAQLLSYFIVMSGISTDLTNSIVALDPSITTFFLVIAILYLILGCILEATSMIYLTVPLLLPIVNALGIDLIWFGVILVIFIEIGQITPPVGLNLYVLYGICNNFHETSFGEVVRGIIPYVFLYLLLALIIMLIPELALWLPSTMR